MQPLVYLVFNFIPIKVVVNTQIINILLKSNMEYRIIQLIIYEKFKILLQNLLFTGQL